VPAGKSSLGESQCEEEQDNVAVGKDEGRAAPVLDMDAGDFRGQWVVKARVPGSGDCLAMSSSFVLRHGVF
jgi:hypothetical protein